MTSFVEHTNCKYCGEEIEHDKLLELLNQDMDLSEPCYCEIIRLIKKNFLEKKKVRKVIYHLRRRIKESLPFDEKEIKKIETELGL